MSKAAKCPTCRGSGYVYNRARGIYLDCTNCHTMKLTKTQLEWLAWLHDNGGSGYIDRHWVIANGQKSRYGSAIAFLNLVAKGAIEGKKGRLLVSEYGRRCLGLSNTSPAEPTK